MKDAEGKDPYLWWRMALDGIEIGGPNLPIHADKPQPGFYRMKRGGHFEPVAIFENGEGLIALVGAGKNSETHDAPIAWLRCCTNPVTEAAYRQACASGLWDDIHPAIYDQPAVASPSDRDRLAAKMGNLTNEAEAIATLGVNTDIHAEQAQSLRARILELVKEADLKRETEKRPHLEAGRRIDEAWRDIIGGGKDASQIISRAVGVFLQRREIEGKANAPAPVTIKGGYGRAASVREITKIERVIDWALLFAHYANDQRAQDLILDLAQKDINRGISVPHVETRKEKALR